MSLSSKVEVTVLTLTLFIGVSETCLFADHNFVLHGWISKFYVVNDHHNKMICHVQELCLLLSDQGHSPHFNFVDWIQ